MWTAMTPPSCGIPICCISLPNSTYHLLSSCVSMLNDLLNDLVDEDMLLPMFRLFSILTRDLTIKSLFLDDVSARWTEESSLPAGDVKNFSVDAHPMSRLKSLTCRGGT